MRWVTCHECRGYGHVTGDGGEIAICPKCKGNTVEPERDKLGRFVK